MLKVAEETRQEVPLTRNRWVGGNQSLVKKKPLKVRDRPWARERQSFAQEERKKRRERTKGGNGGGFVGWGGFRPDPGKPMIQPMEGGKEKLRWKGVAEKGKKDTHWAKWEKTMKKRNRVCRSGQQVKNEAWTKITLIGRKEGNGGGKLVPHKGREKNCKGRGSLGGALGEYSFE